ncbi:MAG: helix-turn-helix domain-containing protein [Rubrivivax sp.]
MAQLAAPPQPALAARNRAPVQLWWPTPALGRCVRAIVARSTLGLGQAWPSAWHYNHFPATPMCSIGWFTVGHSELLPPGAAASLDCSGQRLPRVYFAGPFSRPAVSRNSAEGHGLMLMLLPDAVQALTGLNPADWVNRIAPLDEALGADWQALGQAVLQAADDAERVQRIEDFLTPRWQQARPPAAWPGWWRVQDWAQGLALRAAETGAGRSLRQAERRIKGWAGLPLRELRGLGRAEQAFLRVLAQGEQPVRWTDVAADTGYADQSHLCRETRRITGFAPAELRRLIDQEESFWVYRVWG